MSKKTKLIIVLFCGFIALSHSGLCFIAGKFWSKKIAVDFSVSNELEVTTSKYSFLTKSLSDYICGLCEEMNLDSDLVVSILMVENPEFDPDAIHRNENGTIDVGLFQLNDYYLWTTFKKDYWFDNIELNPFNWKHNTYVAVHHISALQKQLKVQDDVIMAYNGGKGAVMNGTVKPSTKDYLAKVKNNFLLLKEVSNECSVK